MITSVAAWQLTNTKNKPNEDRYRLLGGHVPLVARADRGQLFAVADGVGDARMGMQAAQHAMDRLVDFFREPRPPATATALHDLLCAIDAEVHAWGNDERGLSLGAAAATVAWFVPPVEEDGDGHVVLLHVGDTGAALLSGADARWLTHDHNASCGALRNYVGIGPGFDVEARTVAMEPGDLLVLVTDGITRAMQLDAVRDTIVERPLLAGDFVARQLCERARHRGCSDDITAVVVELEEW